MKNISASYWTTFIIMFLLAVTVLNFVKAQAATDPDPTQNGAYPAYPSYLGASCGGVTLRVVQEVETPSGLLTMVRATTNCNGSGRGAKVRHYLTCTRVQFAPDRVYIVPWQDPDTLLFHPGEQVSSYLGTNPAPACPVL